jgi:hypothetical protein
MLRTAPHKSEAQLCGMLGSLDSMTGYTCIPGIVNRLWALYLVVEYTAHAVHVVCLWICLVSEFHLINQWSSNDLFALFWQSCTTVHPDILRSCTHLPFQTSLGKMVCTAMRGDTLDGQLTRCPTACFPQTCQLSSLFRVLPGRSCIGTVGL